MLPSTTWPDFRAWRPLALAAAVGLCLSACAYLGTSASPLTSANSETASEQPSAESTASPSPDATPVDGSVAAGLALIRPVDGIGQVFVIDPDGSARQVSGLGEHAPVSALLPLWSPDRTQVAFRPGLFAGAAPQLWVVKADGSRQRALGPVGANISWSGNSKTLLYEDSGQTVDTTGEPQRLWLLDVATGEARVIGRGTSPQWMPDGRRISYRPIPPGTIQDEALPFVITRLPRGEPRQFAVARGAWWSPDGGSLLLQQADGLHLAEADGSNARLLVEGFAPVWSPDGTRVVYEYDVTPEEALPIIGVVDLDGNVLWSEVVGSEPAWSPDGTKLAVEVGFPDASIAILDATTGEVIWELEGSDPAWAFETAP
jgi:Tol biopolymer transport system component